MYLTTALYNNGFVSLLVAKMLHLTVNDFKVSTQNQHRVRESCQAVGETIICANSELWFVLMDHFG